MKDYNEIPDDEVVMRIHGRMHNMDTEQLVKELLAEKDPYTLLTKASRLTAVEAAECMKNDDCLFYVFKVIKDNPEIKQRVQEETKKWEKENGQRKEI